MGDIEQAASWLRAVAHAAFEAAETDDGMGRRDAQPLAGHLHIVADFMQRWPGSPTTQALASAMAKPVPGRVSDVHEYLSTSCLHFDHGYCGGSEGYDAAGAPFPKRPGQCKWCAAKCLCPCHKESGHE